MNECCVRFSGNQWSPFSEIANINNYSNLFTRFMDSPPAKRLKMSSGKEVETLESLADELRDEVKEIKEDIKKKELEILQELREELKKAKSDAVREEMLKQITAIRNEITAIRSEIAAKENQIAAILNQIAEIRKETKQITGGPSSGYHVAKVPTTMNISSLASSGGSTVKNLYENVPIFAHWFGVQMCRAYESAKELVSKDADPIQMMLENDVYEISRESLKKVMTATKVATTLHEDAKEYKFCRGLNGCPELRTCEITFTSLYTRALDRFLFPNDETGACLHQFPCRKRRSNPEVSDLYIVPFEQTFRPGDPLLLSEMKMDSLQKAIDESILYSAAGVQEGTSQNFPVLIGIPSCTATAELQLHVYVHDKVWMLEIARACPYDGALLCTLKAGVEHLIKYNSLVQSTPLTFLTPFKEMENYDILGPRKLTFHNKHNNTVFKFYDRGIRLEENLNLDAMRTLVRDVKPLEGMKLTPVSDTSRLYELSYKYVEDGDHPLTLQSFFGVVSTLCEMHRRNLVHGDIRLPNMVFGAEKSFLIDFDFVGKNNSDRYPRHYNSQLCERHKDATPGGKMMLIHDRHSLKYIIEKKVSGLAKDAPILKELMDSGLSLDVLRLRYFADN